MTAESYEPAALGPSARSTANVAPANESNLTESARSVPASLIQRLQVIRFPLVVSVVFHHNGTGTVRLADGIAMSTGPLDAWARAIHTFVAYGLGGIRMPTFFLISGFLFFTGIAGRGDWMWRKLSSRTQSILLPLVLWNAMVLLMLLLTQSLPFTKVYFSGHGAWSAAVRDFGWFDVLNALFGISGDPILYPLWFLRDLFLMCLLAPVFFVMPRVAQWALVMSFGVLWLLDAWPYEVPTVQSGFFFGLGALLALSRRNLFLMDGYLPWTCAAFFGLVTASWIVPEQHRIAPMLMHLEHLAGVVLVLSLSKPLLAMPRVGAWLIAVSASSFFLFVAHEPLLTLVRKTMWITLGPHATGAATVLCTVLLLLLVYHAAEKMAPRLLSALTGGRSN